MSAYGVVKVASCSGVCIPLDANGEFPRARHRLDNNVALLYAAGQQLRLGALEERVNDLGVPSRMDDADAQAGAVMLLRSWTLHCDWMSV